MGASQDRLAMILGVSKRTVENRIKTAGIPQARPLLKIVEADPQHTLKALSA